MIRLLSLGEVSLHDDRGAELDAVLAQPKRFALLFYLATAGHGYHRRDTLFDLFWREADQSHARAALNQSIYFLRRCLGREVILSRGNDDVAVDPSLLWCDMAAFDAALDTGDRESALELYGGELLPGFFLSDAPGWERWLDPERDRLRGRAADAARELAEAALARGNPADAARWARRAVEVVPYDEIQLRRLLTLLAGVGDRARAVTAYEEAAARFAADYEGELSGTTRRLMERIHAGEVEELQLAHEPSAGARPGGPGKAGATGEWGVGQEQPSSPQGTDDAVRASGVETPGDPGRAPHPNGGGGAGARAAPRRRSLWPVAALGLGALLGIGTLAGPGALAWLDAGGAGGGSGSGADPSLAIPGAADRLAVLPLTAKDLGGDRAYLADAITDGLIRRLSGLAGLEVIAWRSVEPYRDTRPHAAQIGDRLGARYLLDGDIEPADVGLRLDARLVEAATGRTVWSHRYETAAEDAGGVEGRMAVDVARALSIEIDAADRERLRDPGTDDPEARRAYLEGRYLLGKSDEASFREALARFRAAVDRDPTYAEAWSGMSDAYDHLGGIGAMPSADAYSRARSAAERALDIQPDLAEGHASLAMALSHHYWMSEDAERHWRRALELRPSDARVRRTYASHLRNLGRFDEALAHATIARDLDPIPFFSHFELLVIPYFRDRYEEVVELASRLAAADPGYGYAHFMRGLALVQLERYDEALAALDAVDPRGTFPDARLIRAYVAGRRGDEAAARSELRALGGDSNPGARGFERAVLHIALGERDRAITALQEAYDAHQSRLRLVGYEPMFDPLRGDRRFQDLLERIGLGASRGTR